MKVLHCCLANFYIDNFSYQENIFPKIHKLLGYDVEIVASTETYVDRVHLKYIDASSYISRDGIPITRLPYVSWLPAFAGRKLRFYKGLNEELNRFRPDILFLHDCQFLSIIAVVSYVKRTGATVYVDSHTDYVNSGRNFISRYVLHGLVYRFCAKLVEPYTKKFYPTLPIRGDFLKNVYGISEDKIELLTFGVDDSRIKQADRDEVRASLREELSIPENAFVFVTGGKIYPNKSIHTFLEAFCRLVDGGELHGTYLIIFGLAEGSMRDAVERAAKNDFVRSVGWLDAIDIHKYLWTSDIAVFPGTHSVLWEEAMGLGVPCIFKRWPGHEHVDIGGNCLLLDEVNESILEYVILDLANNPTKVEEMKNVATVLGPKIFSYTKIAKRAIASDDDKED